MTLAVMRAFGVDVEVSSRAFVVRAGQRYVGTDYAVEPDASGASYAFAASAIAGGEVLAEGVHLPSLQGDIRLLEILREMGCTYKDTPEGVVVSRAGALRGVSVDMNTMPDVVPTLAVVALFAEGTTTIRNVAHLRHKESDRIQVLADEFRKMGAVIRTEEDGLAVDPSPLHGAELDPHDDHRMAMVFGLAGLRVPGVRVDNPGCVKKSFPRFWEEFERLRSFPAAQC
jgi:3-phosphoshikimate 1-carboxyvinyltransferase